jgi:hypothetical protein
LQDTGNIVAAVDPVNDHLTSICHAIPPIIIRADAGC